MLKTIILGLLLSLGSQAKANIVGVTVAGFPTAAQALSVSSPAFATGATRVGFVKGSAAVLSKIIISNVTANLVSVKIYNQTTAPTAGSGTPVFRCTQPAVIGTCTCDLGPQGMALATGLAYSVTGGIADTDTTALGTDAAVSFIYK